MGRELHVTCDGNDGNEGSVSRPFRTISHAAGIARPGDVVTIHAGVYREWVRPARGGLSDAQRIVYQAAPGEEVVIKASEAISAWEHVREGVWKTILPNSFFGVHNPYAEILEGDWFRPRGRIHHTGEVYLNGRSLFEVESLDKVLNPPQSAFTWYCETSTEETTIWVNCHQFDPRRELVEINVRRACFYPEKTGIDYITVCGFRMCHAATQWAPPTAEQTGIIGPHWAKGWIIESNIIHDSKCSGISLGWSGSGGQNLWSRLQTKHGTQRQREVTFQALHIGWSKETIGSHIVRNNTIYNCEQTGICGNLGGVFSEISGNHIYDIHVKDQFNGMEIAGVKLHAPLDTLIRNNHIHNCRRGIWMDWQAQGLRITGNLLYGNSTDDIFVEVSHGPCVIDNNILLSPVAFKDMAQGAALAHNLFAGAVELSPVPERYTHYHFPHSTDVAGMMSIMNGDDRYFGNIFVARSIMSDTVKVAAIDGRNVPEAQKSSADDPDAACAGLSIYDEFPIETDPWNMGRSVTDYATFKLPVHIASNLYLNGARPYRQEKDALVSESPKSGVELESNGEKVLLHLTIDADLDRMACPMVTTDLLGKAFQAEAPYEQPDGTPLRIGTDYLGEERPDSPRVGPFENLRAGRQTFIVWHRPLRLSLGRKEP